MTTKRKMMSTRKLCRGPFFLACFARRLGVYIVFPVTPFVMDFVLRTSIIYRTLLISNYNTPLSGMNRGKTRHFQSLPGRTGHEGGHCARSVYN